MPIFEAIEKQKQQMKTFEKLEDQPFLFRPLFCFPIQFLHQDSFEQCQWHYQ